MKILFWARIAMIVALAAGAMASACAQDAPPAGHGNGGGLGSGGGAGRGVRGTVTAISGAVVTVKTDTGDTYQVTTGANTRVIKERQPIEVKEIKVGDAVLAGGAVDPQAKTVGAAFLVVLSAEQAARAETMRASLGKTWVGGKVTAIDGLRITVQRIDNVSQAITVDENTSFRHRRESITLADIKVGDSVTARGALKGDAFVATEVNTGEGGMRGERGAGGPGGNAGGPPQQ